MENLIFSPMSIAVLLSLLQNGTSGPSERELRLALHISQDSGSYGVNKVFRNILQPIKYSTDSKLKQGMQLKMVTRMYINRNMKLQLKKDFERILKKMYFSEVVEMNFSNATGAAKEINTWVSSMTNCKITDIISRDSISGNPAAAFMIVNAIYFKASWLHEFQKSESSMDIFHLSKTATTSVRMMNQANDFMYAHMKDKDAKMSVLEMPFANAHKGGPGKESYSMLIYLPDRSSSLEAVETLLKNLSVYEVRAEMTDTTQIVVTIPKFKMETTLQLTPILEKIGIGGIFNPRSANFGNITTSSKGKELFVSEIVHKAFIDINETGTEAASPSSHYVPRCSAPFAFKRKKSIIFKVDRPFVFQIINANSNYVLFSGKCSDP